MNDDNFTKNLMFGLEQRHPYSNSKDLAVLKNRVLQGHGVLIKADDYTDFNKRKLVISGFNPSSGKFGDSFYIFEFRK